MLLPILMQAISEVGTAWFHRASSLALFWWVISSPRNNFDNDYLLCHLGHRLFLWWFVAPRFRPRPSCSWVQPSDRPRLLSGGWRPSVPAPGSTGRLPARLLRVHLFSMLFKCHMFVFFFLKHVCDYRSTEQERLPALYSHCDAYFIHGRQNNRGSPTLHLAR